MQPRLSPRGRRRAFRPETEAMEARRLLATFTVKSTDDAGLYTLRQAILDANTRPGLDRIEFQVGTGRRTIALMSSLATITDPVVIDATTQPGFAGTPLIELDGTRAGEGSNGLTITAGGSTVRGLIVNRFHGSGILLQDGGGNTIAGNFIGVDALGAAGVGNFLGIYAFGSSNNTIGGTTPADRNVISGNFNGGVQVTGSRTPDDTEIILATGNRILGNFLGTDAAGLVTGGPQPTGVLLGPAAADNIVGGDVPGARNVISGNAGSSVGGEGVRIFDVDATGNRILGNFIGTDVSGKFSLANSRSGVSIVAARDNIIGGDVPGARNVISGNADPLVGSDGVQISENATGNRILGNYIGTDADGMLPLANSRSGVCIMGAPGNTLDRNVISGNGTYGVFLNGNPVDAEKRVTGPSLNVLTRNFIGTNASGKGAIPNKFAGVYILNSDQNTIGGAAPGAGNVISGNTMHGVFVNTGTQPVSSRGNVLLGNFIGTDAQGGAKLGNGGIGVLINYAPGNTIGGVAPGAGNVISGNAQDGVVIGFESAEGNTVLGNRIGTDATGTRALGNGTSGVRLSIAPRNRVGGAEPGAGNLISGNARNGVFLFGSSAEGNTVLGNRIGTDATGARALGNVGQGILLTDAPGNVIGGTVSGSGNLVSGNAENGIQIDGISTGIVVRGNRVGTDATGIRAVGNGGHGVLVNNTRGNLIGGTTLESRNLIAGNGGSGVTLLDRGATSNSVQGNFIGTDASGSLALGNAADGVLVFNAPSNTIGGPSAEAGNLIAGNRDHGIEIVGRPSTGTAIAHNRIGTTASGMAALGNRRDGLLVTNAPGTSVAGNLIAGNLGAGVELAGLDATGAAIAGNQVGTDLAGRLAIGNGTGILINGAPGNLVANNLVSGNRGTGVLIAGPGAAGNRVRGNRVGTDRAGAVALGNQTGIAIQQAPGNLIGGATAEDRNIISGNTSAGVFVFGDGAKDNVVLGNYVGTDASGLRAILGPVTSGTLAARADVGVAINTGAAGNTIGGATPGARNVIAGNGVGVVIAGAGAGRNRVLGNYVGTDVTGASALSNGVGVYINGASGNVVGDTAANAGNVISGNISAGVYLFGAQAVENAVLGNRIGTDAAGKDGLRGPGRTFLQDNGVLISTGASRNKVGDTTAASGNLIAGNASANVYLLGPNTSNNTVFSNRIGLPAGPRTLYGVLLFNAPNNTVAQSGPSRNTFAGSGIANVREFSTGPAARSGRRR